MAAAAAFASGVHTSSSGGFSPYTGTTDASYKSDPLTGTITFVASNNADNDVWLRTDGGNKMHATLNFDGANPADRMIVGASSLQNFAGQALHIGNASGLTPVTGAGVVIESDAEILGDFRIRRTLTVDNTLNVTGDINASANVNAQNVNARGIVTGQAFVDADNSAYYVNPDSTSNLNSLAANYIASNGRVRAGEFVEIAGVANEGWGCSPNGLVGRTAAGGILSCQSGIWRGSESKPTLSGGYGGYSSCRRVYELGNVPIYCAAGETAAGIYITTEGGGQAANLMCCS